MGYIESAKLEELADSIPTEYGAYLKGILKDG